MAGRGKGARLKGANFERTIANLLTEKTHWEWKRGLGQTRSGGEEVSDVYSEQLPFIHIETKCQKAVNIRNAYLQAVADIGTKQKTPVIITKDDRSDILVTMRLEDWLELFNRYYPNDQVHEG
jgi:hypothetical protein